MSSLDENLFGRIAVLNGYLRRDQLDVCLQLQRSASPHRAIGQILREKGYITDEQLRTILEIRRKKARKLAHKPDEAKKSNASFGELAVKMKLITLDDLEEAVLEQQRLSGLNLHFCLGEILVVKQKMKVADVLGVLSQQGKCLLACPGCDCHFNVTKFREGKLYACPRCGDTLVKPKFLDAVAVDGVIEG